MESSRVISSLRDFSEFCRSSRGASRQLAQLALHELEMDVQRVQRVADLVRDARREQRERGQPLRLWIVSSVERRVSVMSRRITA